MGDQPTRPKKRTLYILIASETDMPQTVQGRELLAQYVADGTVEVIGVYTASIHWNTDQVLLKLRELNKAGNVDILITGAGWANHLSGTVDHYLRNALGDDHITVIGVSFESSNDPEATTAAKLSVSKVPKTQMIYGDADGQFVGPDGFLRACKFAVTGDLPRITLPTTLRLTKERTFYEFVNGIEPDPARLANEDRS